MDAVWYNEGVILFFIRFITFYFSSRSENSPSTRLKQFFAVKKIKELLQLHKK